MAVVQGVLEEQVEANLGMAMIYTLIGAAQEWIEDKVGSRPATLFAWPATSSV